MFKWYSNVHIAPISSVYVFAIVLCFNGQVVSLVKYNWHVAFVFTDVLTLLLRLLVIHGHKLI